MRLNKNFNTEEIVDTPNEEYNDYIAWVSNTYGSNNNHNKSYSEVLRFLKDGKIYLNNILKRSILPEEVYIEALYTYTYTKLMYRPLYKAGEDTTSGQYIPKYEEIAYQMLKGYIRA